MDTAPAGDPALLDDLEHAGYDLLITTDRALKDRLGVASQSPTIRFPDLPGAPRPPVPDVPLPPGMRVCALEQLITGSGPLGPSGKSAGSTGHRLAILVLLAAASLPMNRWITELRAAVDRMAPGDYAELAV